MRFLSKKEVKALTLYSDAHRARFEEAGPFPKRVRLGNGRYARVGY
jgi:predicted DNA-binding transcriptional regulator AlpA